MVCCTCDLCSMLGTGIYYLCVLDSISLMMLMMIEGPERFFYYFFYFLLLLLAWARLCNRDPHNSVEDYDRFGDSSLYKFVSSTCSPWHLRFSAACN